MKYIITFISLFWCFLLSNAQANNNYYYKPMSKRTINFGDDVCYYEENINNTQTYYRYVKPCEEGKICLSLNSAIYSYDISICQEYNNDEEYDNEKATCETKDYLSGIDCTYGYTCNSDSKCLGRCAKNQVYDNIKKECHDGDPGYCIEREYNTDGSLKETKSNFTPYGKKQCIQIDLVKTGAKDEIYKIQKIWSNYKASIDDGKYINSIYYYNYCKSGYALYFYGNEQLKNPNTDASYKSDEKMFARCVTILGIDTNGIIKYRIGDNGDEKYYNPSELSGYSLPSEYDEYFKLRKDFWSNFKKRLDNLDCKETNDCEDDELNKWLYYYNHPEEYLLYQNEPQVMEYLIQKSYYKYKAKHTSSNASNLLNIKYLVLLSLLLLF